MNPTCFLLCLLCWARLVSSFVSFIGAATKRRSFLLAAASTSDADVNVVNYNIPLFHQQRLWKGQLPQVQVVDTMPENLPLQLKHIYYLLRHGQSTANVDEVISSDRSLAYSTKHGLTDVGYDQGFESAYPLLDLLKSNSKPGDRLVFVSSPFARARETAQACLDGILLSGNRTTMEHWQQLDLQLDPQIYYHDLLMERYFGRLDDEAIYTYAYVWPLDRINVTHTAFGVESVAAVCTRWKQLIEDLELQLSQNDDDDSAATAATTTHVVLVSHADVLQIAQLYAAQAPNVGEFSSYRFKNGEIRRMELGTGLDNLPPAKPLPAPQRGTGM